LPSISAYHDVDAATHQANVTKLSAEGYHQISLCVYGDPSAPLYAAVWAQEASPQWIAVHGQTESQYQAWITGTVEAQGFSLRLVTATGEGANVVFAAVAEKSGIAWQAQHGLTDATLQSFLTAQRQAGSIPTAIAPYGDVSSRLYAAVCQGSDPAVQWDYPGSPLTADDWQGHFNAYARVPARPGVLSVTSDGLYVGVFRNDSLGPEIVRHGMSSSDYQNAVNQLTAQGFFPVCVAAGGTGAATRFAAAFAQQTAPQPRAWTATGAPVSLLSGIDSLVQDFMKTYGVRAGQVAVVRNGTLVYSRGFTWGESTYRITQPTSLMRIASCSKAFTSAAINALVNAGQLHLTDAVFPLLGITTPSVSGQAPDPNINKVTVQNLLDHLGGFNDDGSSGVVYVQTGPNAYTQVPSSNFDPAFQARAISQALGLPGPPSKRDVAGYMYGQALQFVPGTTVYSRQPNGTFSVSGTGAYSNFGYMLLGMVVEAASGLPFVDYLRSTVLAPLGLSDVAVSRILAGAAWPNEVGYDEPTIGPTPFDPASSGLVPAVDGGEGLITEVFDAPSGLMTSAQSMATFIHTNAVWGIGGRAPGFARSGSEAGSSSLAASRTDNLDWAYIFNTRWSLGDRTVTNAQGTSELALDKLGDDIGNLLNGISWPVTTAPVLKKPVLVQPPR
jgi:CubicO group peptidase (beta-lactamase class C family)